MSHAPSLLTYIDYLRADPHTNLRSMLPVPQMSRLSDTGSPVSMQMAMCSAMMTEDIR